MQKGKLFLVGVVDKSFALFTLLRTLLDWRLVNFTLKSKKKTLTLFYPWKPSGRIPDPALTLPVERSWRE